MTTTADHDVGQDDAVVIVGEALRAMQQRLVIQAHQCRSHHAADLSEQLGNAHDPRGQAALEW